MRHSLLFPPPDLSFASSLLLLSSSLVVEYGRHRIEIEFLVSVKTFVFEKAGIRVVVIVITGRKEREVCARSRSSRHGRLISILAFGSTAGGESKRGGLRCWMLVVKEKSGVAVQLFSHSVRHCQFPSLSCSQKAFLAGHAESKLKCADALISHTFCHFFGWFHAVFGLPVPCCSNPASLGCHCNFALL